VTPLTLRPAPGCPPMAKSQSSPADTVVGRRRSWVYGGVCESVRCKEINALWSAARKFPETIELLKDSRTDNPKGAFSNHHGQFEHHNSLERAPG